ncbi:hypothetical protein TREPR_0459 [Treponema primitia ZAS-2]|uniref:Uncharacterized protein n=1 Tax=Treponema primitia (strain ATCC BAA-887 / DSM 12427 / ZAS-2) TaxID=545694 RepID=F5YM47_TREPZ|nr:hypothetical protein [Treponema primitia]AEF83619.1 hypothetical protein TREPR_0459 [Treponema primitia ZAS-2]
MLRFCALGLLLFSIPLFVLPAQEVLRGQVWVELEPMPGQFIEDPAPPDAEALRRRALEEASLFFSAMVYGWAFHYDIGEQARNIPEQLELEPQGVIPWGDPGLFATDTEVRDNRLYMWADFRPSAAQRRRLSTWTSGMYRSAQAVGHGPLGGPVLLADWVTIKQAALEDAARAAIRTMLRGSERQRPKAAEGFISLAEFPVFWRDAGQWAASGRFRVKVEEVIPFAAY